MVVPDSRAGISDESLVEEVQNGQEEAFVELVTRYQGRIINFLYRFIGNYERAEEIAQEVFLRIAVKADRFDRKYRFSTWIYTIAKNLGRNALRDRARRGEAYRIRDVDWDPDALESLAQFRSAEADPMEKVAIEEAKAILETVMAALDANWRAALIMKEYDRMTYDEIAQAMEVAPGTVKSWVYRAKESLAKALRDKGII